MIIDFHTHTFPDKVAAVAIPKMQQASHSKAFTAIFLAAGALTWQGWISIFIIAAKLISNAGYGNKNTLVLRLMSLLTSVFWLVYNVYVFTLAGILCEAFAIGSILVALWRFHLWPRLSSKVEEC